MEDKKETKNFHLNFSAFFEKSEIIFRRFGYYFRIWFMMSKNSFLMFLNQKSVFVIFLTGKILRFLFYIFFLIFLVKGADGLAGYNTNQAIFFFLTFMVVDTTAQFLYRDVYRFRQLIVTGDFDLVLVKPVNALFRVLMGGADVADLMTLPPLYLATIYVGNLLSPTPAHVFLYLFLIIVGLMISTAFHIIVLSFGIITFEIDHSIMIYRDISNMGRFPIDIYKEPLKSALTYFVPIGIMVTLPAKALMGLVNFQSVIVAFLLSILLTIASTRFWKFALSKYSSASS
jgi:ABC-2 type transport system permease protein